VTITIVITVMYSCNFELETGKPVFVNLTIIKLVKNEHVNVSTETIS